MTQAQERAWQTLWPRYGIDGDRAGLDPDLWFGRHAKRTLEIGFGNGEALVTLAAANPERDHVGIEVHRPGVGHLLLRCSEFGVDNVRVICGDAIESLGAFARASFDEVLLYFPDPWPKKRHHKRRIVQPAFVALVARVLSPGGTFRLATDWLPYAEHMMTVLEASDAFENCAGPHAWSPRPAARPITRFESRGERLGHEVRDLAYRRR